VGSWQVVGLLQKVLRKSPLLKTVGVFIPPRNVQILGVEGAGVVGLEKDTHTQVQSISQSPQEN
jgi:hypothetical protein